MERHCHLWTQRTQHYPSYTAPPISSQLIRILFGPFRLAKLCRAEVLDQIEGPICHFYGPWSAGHGHSFWEGRGGVFTCCQVSIHKRPSSLFGRSPILDWLAQTGTEYGPPLTINPENKNLIIQVNMREQWQRKTDNTAIIPTSSKRVPGDSSMKLSTQLKKMKKEKRMNTNGLNFTPKRFLWEAFNGKKINSYIIDTYRTWA